MTRGVLFHVQHLLGIGHLKRADILAEGMAAQGLDVTVALGGPPLPGIRFRGAKIAELPAARIANEDFSTLLDAAGRPVDESWKAARKAALLELARRTAPDVVLVELFPFGRRQFRFELIPLLEQFAEIAPRPRIACSVRDILVASRKPGRDAEIVSILRRFFDRVLVHGDPTLIPFGATFDAVPQIADLIRYTGYITAPAEPAAGAGPDDGAGEVLISAGGGAVGAPLLRAAMGARPLTPLADHVWRFLTGPNLPDDEFNELARGADGRTIVERFQADFPARLKTAALSISQAGYNTTMDILRAGARAIVIPYEAPGETEQRLRSDILAQQGLLTILPAAELSSETLAHAVEAALARPVPKLAKFDLDGATTAARLVAELAEERWVGPPLGRHPRASDPRA